MQQERPVKLRLTRRGKQVRALLLLALVATPPVLITNYLIAGPEQSVDTSASITTPGEAAATDVLPATAVQVEHEVPDEGEDVALAEQPATPKTALLIGDSQLDGDSWAEQGLRAAGFEHIEERAYGGGGYASPATALGVSVAQGVVSGAVPLPDEAPDLVSVVLGGNDANTWQSDDAIRAQLQQLIAYLQARYPETRIVVNGVMSRNEPEHDRRMQVDRLIRETAPALGVDAISVSGWGSAYGADYLDGIHLSQAGHTTIGAPYAEALLSTLAVE